MDISDKGRSIITRWTDGWSASDQLDWIKLHTQDVVYTDHAFQISSIPDFVVEEEHIWLEESLPGNKSRLVFKTVNTGIFVNNLPGIKATGRPFWFPGVVELIVRNEDGLIEKIEEWYTFKFHSVASIDEKVLQALEEGKENQAANFIEQQGFEWADHVGSRKETVLHRAVELDYEQVVVSITKRYKGAVDACDRYGRIPLHYVTTKPNAANIAQVLLEAGSSVDALDCQNLTPLHNLVWRPKEEESMGVDEIHPTTVMKHLLDNGAEPTARCCRESGRGNDEALTGARADSECRNFNDKTPQDLVRDLPDNIDKATLDRLLRSINEWDPNDARVVQTIPTDEPKCWGKAPGNTTDNSGRNDIDHGSQKVCEKFNMNIRFYYRDKHCSQSWSVSVHDLLHQKGRMTRLEDEFAEFVFGQLRADGEVREEADEEEVKKTVKEKCWRWIHLPVNQMSWVTDLVWRLTEPAPDTMDKSTDQSSDDQAERRKEAWQFLSRNIAQRKGANGVFTRMPHAGDFLKNKSLDEQETENTEEIKSSAMSTTGSLYRGESWRNSTQFPSDDKISIVVPYIDFETREYLQHLTEARTSDKYKPQSPGFRHKFELEQMSRPYKRLRGLHKSQTLDASYYDTLTDADLMERDEDQVVLKWFERFNERGKKRHGDGKPLKRPYRQSSNSRKQTPVRWTLAKNIRDPNKQARLLMVHQLWLWKLDKDTIITAFPDRYHRGVEDTLFDTIRQGGIHSYTDPHELIEDILFESVTFLEEFQYAGLGIHVLDIFDSSIAECSQEEAKRFDEFSESIDPDGAVDKTSDITSEINLISKCKDIRDELHLILRIFETQQNVVKKFSDLFWPKKAASKLNQAFIDDCGVGHLIERTKALDGHANRTLQALDYLVQIKQAQSSLDEAQSAGQLNKAIWIFTLVTVIFTPLSFMTSLFAIPFTYHPQNSEGEIRVEEGWFTNRMAIGECVSVAVIALAILISFTAPSPKRAFARLKSSWNNSDWKRIWEKIWPLDTDSDCNDTKPPQHDEDQHSIKPQRYNLFNRKTRVPRGNEGIA
ncbi:hypothetical protein CEP52_002936 [Fusarium oligoseptatum]|uniref:Uncharacterized protein n=1 Tax=Fusarium oligoseptatum TaxID=2604345 RepID=A0A428UBQ2_9HYPO|nr:hypothetical protein CEP52_002936 [Fusarium oligoseptatum]